MHRIDTPTAQKDKFGAGKNGFTRGNPQTGTPATELDDDYFDAIQEELTGIIEASGAAPDKSKRNQLLVAMKTLLLSRVNPFADIKADGPDAVTLALSNLGLGTSAKKDVGSGASQIPDMSFFASSLTANGYQKLPGGYIMQWMNVSASATASAYNIPIAWPNGCLQAVGTTQTGNDQETTASAFVELAILPQQIFIKCINSAGVLQARGVSLFMIGR